jgi:N-acetylneuraminic acid mutarotase
MVKTIRVVSTSIAVLLLGCQILLAQGGAWTTRAPMPFARARASAATVDGIIYVAGGYTFSGPRVSNTGTLQAYNPKTNSWTIKSPLPTPRSAAAAVALGGKLYVLGGFNTSGGTDNNLATVEAYDPKTDTWTTKAPMPTARSGLAAAVVDGIIYAIGGSAPNVELATVEAYDPSTNSWSARAAMPEPREVSGAGVVNGVIYAAGGSGTADYSKLEAYDPKTNSWTTKSPMPSLRMGVAVGQVGGLLYLAGGFDFLGYLGPGGTDQSFATVQAYDPTANDWEPVSPMLTPRAYAATAIAEDTLYVMGGTAVGPGPYGPLYAVNEAFSPYLPVTIRVNPATINLRSNEKIKVAILSTSTFDATSVVPDSVKLSGALADTERNGTPLYSFDDVNGDGILDLVLTFRARNLQLTKADKQVVLKGQTFAGQLIKGVATVRIVP